VRHHLKVLFFDSSLQRLVFLDLTRSPLESDVELDDRRVTFSHPDEIKDFLGVAKEPCKNHIILRVVTVPESRELLIKVALGQTEAKNFWQLLEQHLQSRSLYLNRYRIFHLFHPDDKPAQVSPSNPRQRVMRTVLLVPKTYLPRVFLGQICGDVDQTGLNVLK